MFEKLPEGIGHALINQRAGMESVVYNHLHAQRVAGRLSDAGCLHRSTSARCGLGRGRVGLEVDDHVFDVCRGGVAHALDQVRAQPAGTLVGKR